MRFRCREHRLNKAHVQLVARALKYVENCTAKGKKLPRLVRIKFEPDHCLVFGARNDDGHTSATLKRAGDGHVIATLRFKSNGEPCGLTWPD